MADRDTYSRAVTALKNKLEETQLASKRFKEKVMTRLNNAEDPLSIGGCDGAGLVLGLSSKAGLEVLSDWIRKKTTAVGQFRAPDLVSGGIATGIGLAGYIGNLAIDYDFPMYWWREIPRSTFFTIAALGIKELGQAGVVWNEQRQQKVLAATAQQMIAAAQQQQAAIDQAKK